MDIKKLLTDMQSGAIDLNQALEQLKSLPYENLEFAHVDHHRQTRQGFPEVIYCEGKTEEQVEKIIAAIIKKESGILATRAHEKLFERLHKKFPQLKYNKPGRVIYQEPKKRFPDYDEKILILSAGTSDISVAEEAYQTAYTLGFKAKKIYDVGVAGIHRLFNYRSDLDEALIIIVVAGMEGALASVVGGLTQTPIVAVPTSVGYGASFGGITALLAMLNSCASGVTVVNIDNGFGAAFAAVKYLKKLMDK
jgi:pyridinium-3,5-biscarboxylic acid mononucleotide synthase